MGRTSSRIVVAAIMIVLVVAVAAGAFLIGRNSAGSPSTQKPESPASSSGTSATVAIAAPGAELPTLRTPPEKSLWALAAGKYKEGVRVSVVFEPYGVGPATHGPSIVARVSSAQPEDGSSEIPDLTGRNVIFILGDAPVKSGGRYKATAVTQKRNDRIVFVLEEVKPASGS